MELVRDFNLGGSKITAMVTAAMKYKEACSFEEKLEKKENVQPRQHIKKQRYYFASKGPFSQSSGFSSSRVWIWELDFKESWAFFICSSYIDLKVYKLFYEMCFYTWIWIPRLRGSAKQTEILILIEQ